jgi:hypothetical protein
MIEQGYEEAGGKNVSELEQKGLSSHTSVTSLRQYCCVMVKWRGDRIR